MSHTPSAAGHEQRRVRFADIGGLVREDLALACEVWLDDLAGAAWGTRDATKLGVYLMRYIADAARAPMSFNEIERRLQMDRKYLMQSLVLMRTYGAVVDFAVDKEELKVALNLSLLQRLRVLEGQRRLAELAAWRRETSEYVPIQAGESWVPESSYCEPPPAEAPPPAALLRRIRRRARPLPPAAEPPALAPAKPPVTIVVQRAPTVPLDWARARRKARSRTDQHATD